MFIGLPASGKSTLIKAIKQPNDWVYSTDAYIEMVASSSGKSYDEVFQETIKTATSEAEKYLTLAIATKAPIIWDQTNLSKKKRKRVIDRLTSSGYRVVAYCVMPPETVEDITEWNRRLHNRPGKSIPEHVIGNMVRSYETPELDEGFSSIRRYNIYGECYEFEA